VHIGVAGHNLFDVAFAWLLATRRGVDDKVDFEMLLGMATGQADAVKRDVGALLLYTPVVHPGEFDSAISYLVRRLEENASSDNFMSSLFELAHNEVAFAREANRFRASLAQFDTAVPPSNRVQDRAHALAALLEDTAASAADAAAASSRADNADNANNAADPDEADSDPSGGAASTTV
jgi:RHH-type proline utilization regulon transcriptional repressor/proline dehydrogenase/delta 1-pyrroline-5-carboxylate dehydrogenase